MVRGPASVGGGESIFLTSRRRIDGTQLILCPACMFGRLAGPGLHLHPPEGPSRGKTGPQAGESSESWQPDGPGQKGWETCVQAHICNVMGVDSWVAFQEAGWVLASAHWGEWSPDPRGRAEVGQRGLSAEVKQDTWRTESSPEHPSFVTCMGEPGARSPARTGLGLSRGPENKGRGELCLGNALVRFTAPVGGAKGANPNHHDPHRWRAGLSDSLEPSRLGGLSKDGSPWLCSHRRHGRSFPVTTDVASGSSRHRLSVTQSWPVRRTCLLQCLELH